MIQKMRRLISLNAVRWQLVMGKVVRGHRLASAIDGNSPFGAGTIELQMPKFKEQRLDLGNCFRGTLNVSIHPKTREVLLAEPRFKNIKWHQDYPPEDFFFSACRITFRGKTYAGWVYYPDPKTKIAHFQNPSLFEIIAETIPSITYGDEISLEVNADEVKINPE